MTILKIALSLIAFITFALPSRAGLISRIEQSASAAVSAYSQTWREFYGVGKHAKMYSATLDLRPDKQPNIILDKNSHSMDVVVCLSVNEANYDSWKKIALGRFRMRGVGCAECDANDASGRMIGGINFKFGENEEAAIKRWESTAAKEEVVVSVRLVDKDKDTVREKIVNLVQFSRPGSKNFPLPYSGLNRLRDLPPFRFGWKPSDKNPSSEDKLEVALAKVSFKDLDDEELDRIEDVLCVVRAKGKSSDDKTKSFVKEKSFTVVYGMGTGKKVKEVKKTVLGTSFRREHLSNIDLKSLVSVSLPRGISSIEPRIFSNCPNLKSVELPDDMTDIGSSTFSGCKRLQTVKLPSRLKIIGGLAFSECLALKSIDLPTGLRSIENNAFADCKSLKTVSIPDGVESVGHMAFARCERIESVSIPNSIKNFSEEVFSRCKNIASVTMPMQVPCTEGPSLKYLKPRTVFADSHILRSIEILDGPKEVEAFTFSGMKSLKEVTIPTGVTNIQKSAFAGCESLESIIIPPGVRIIQEKAFYDCTSLKSVVLSDGLKKIEREAFANCRNLKCIVFPDSVDVLDRFSFAGCTGLKSVELPARGLSMAEGETFKDCTGLCDADGFIIIRGVLFNYAGNASSVVIPAGVVFIADRAFYGQQQLQTVKIPNGVKTIGWGAFAQCIALKEISIPKSATRCGGELFSGCRQLEDNNGFVVLDGVLFGGPNDSKNLEIPQSATEIADFAFDHNNTLESIVIPSGVTKIGKCAFSRCSNLKSVKLPSTLKKIGSAAFQLCKSLASVDLPAGLESTGDGAFYFCEGLKSLTIRDGVGKIGDSSFMGCKGLEQASIPGSVHEISDNAFCGCKFLRAVTINPGVAKIGRRAFCDCAFLRPNIEIPSSMTEIGDEAFRGCSGLVSIDVANKATKISKTAAGGKTRISYVK